MRYDLIFQEHLYSRVAEKNEVAARILQDVETTRWDKNLSTFPPHEGALCP